MTHDLLAEFARFRSESRVLPLDGRGRLFDVSETHLRRHFAGAVRRCPAIPIDKRDRLTFHDIRHTAASLMVAAGVPLFDVAKLLGHSTLAVTMRYAHFAPEAGRSAVDSLGRTLALGARAVVPIAATGTDALPERPGREDAIPAARLGT